MKDHFGFTHSLTSLTHSLSLPLPPSFVSFTPSLVHSFPLSFFWFFSLAFLCGCSVWHFSLVYLFGFSRWFFYWFSRLVFCRRRFSLFFLRVCSLLFRCVFSRWLLCLSLLVFISASSRFSSAFLFGFSLRYFSSVSPFLLGLRFGFLVVSSLGGGLG